jgi:GNAT superfamily N-acetyltransferase
MIPKTPARPPDPFGDDEGILDIHCRPALDEDLPQVASLALGLLDQVFGETIARASGEAERILADTLGARLRHDCTWVMHEGEQVIGMIDLETAETRKLNGPSLAQVLVASLDLAERVAKAGLLPMLVYEPGATDAHQALVALLPGSRGEGRGTLLLMHGAFWARAQGKDWVTAWLRAGDPVLPVYERRGYFVDREFEARGAHGLEDWWLLRRPLSTRAHSMLEKGDGGKGKK